MTNIAAEPQEPDYEHHEPRKRGREHEAVIAVALDGQRDQDDEGAGRAADLETAPAQKRD